MNIFRVASLVFRVLGIAGCVAQFAAIYHNQLLQFFVSFGLTAGACYGMWVFDKLARGEDPRLPIHIIVLWRDKRSRSSPPFLRKCLAAISAAA